MAEEINSSLPFDISQGIYSGLNVLTQDQSAEEDDLVRVHGITLGEFNLIIDTRTLVAEFVKEMSICRLPNTQAWLHGMSNLRSKIVPVFDIARYLGLSEGPIDSENNVLVVNLEYGLVGILLENIPVRLVMDDETKSDALPKLPIGLEDFVHGIYQDGKNEWLEWDMEGFIKMLSDKVNL